MLRSLVLLAVVCVAAATEPQAAAFPGLRGIVEPRLMASGVRIARLERTLKDLKHEIEEASKVDPAGFVNEINTRLDAVEKGRCDNPKDLPCGRDSSECVSTLLLCDGKEDCHNAWDEDEHVCSVGPIVAGNVFSGTATWTSCRLRKDHPVSFQITGILKPKFFGARLGVRARLSFDFADDDEDQKYYDVKGYYVFGKKRLVLIPLEQEESHLGVVCTWNRGDDSRAQCLLVNEATLAECAHFFVHEQS
jgi:hypothetical protein